MRKLREIVIYILIFPLVAKGFYVPAAKQWIEKSFRVIKNKDYRLKDRLYALKRGCEPQHLEKYLNKAEDDKFISEKDYWYIQPLNGIYTKWMGNKVITRRIFSDYKEHLQHLYYQVSANDGEFNVFPLDDCPYEKHEIETVLKLIREKGTVVLTEPRRNRSEILSYDGESFYCGRKVMDEQEVLEFIGNFHKRTIIAEYISSKGIYKNNNTGLGNVLTVNIINPHGNDPRITDAYIRLDDCYTSEINELVQELNAHYKSNYVYEPVRKSEATLETKIFYNNDTLEKGDEERAAKTPYFKGLISAVDLTNGRFSGAYLDSYRKLINVEDRFTDSMIIEGSIPCWEEIKTVIIKMCKHVPQLEFFAVDLVLSDDSFKILPFINVPAYTEAASFSDETRAFLIEKLKDKKAYWKNPKVRSQMRREKIKFKTRKIFSSVFFPKGLKPYLSVRWITEVWDDLFHNKSVSLKDKIWAYRHGFLSYRLEQYGIDESNVNQYISDFEYKWLRHINGSYRAIFEDKITVKYIVNKFKECFPDYYFHIKSSNDGNVMIPMMDCPDGLGEGIDAIFELVKRKGVLALKPDEGSHGDGFYKLSYIGGQYYLNFDRTDKNQVSDILLNPNNQYLVTEYIDNHPQFKEIYEGAVNTIRMIVFKKDGVNAHIGNAYMRFGSKKTGAVDNMGAGGMFVQVDIETGNYGNAKIITNNAILDCPNHPDTGVLMEGTIPHWDSIKETILNIANSIPQLEYFGFDVAVTENGIKLPEINRFPDYPKIEKFSLDTNEYLLDKLRKKKVKYGYDLRPCRKLIHLPKR